MPSISVILWMEESWSHSRVDDHPVSGCFWVLFLFHFCVSAVRKGLNILRIGEVNDSEKSGKLPSWCEQGKRRESNLLKEQKKPCIS